jgi:hypothetical protein
MGGQRIERHSPEFLRVSLHLFIRFIRFFEYFRSDLFAGTQTHGRTDSVRHRAVRGRQMGRAHYFYSKIRNIEKSSFIEKSLDPQRQIM